MLFRKTIDCSQSCNFAIFRKL